MCPGCTLLTEVLEKSIANTNKALGLYNDVVEQRDHYERMLDELLQSVRKHLALCRGDKKPDFERWMN